MIHVTQNRGVYGRVVELCNYGPAQTQFSKTIHAHTTVPRRHRRLPKSREDINKLARAIEARSRKRRLSGKSNLPGSQIWNQTRLDNE
jgi:hypothetical protein